MSTRNAIVRRPERGKVAENISLTASTADAPICVEYLNGLSIHAIWTGTPQGTLQLEASNNAMDGNVYNGVRADANWVVIPGSSVTLSGSADSHIWDISDVYYETVRVSYTAASSTGTLKLYYLGKQY